MRTIAPFRRAGRDGAFCCSGAGGSVERDMAARPGFRPDFNAKARSVQRTAEGMATKGRKRRRSWGSGQVGCSLAGASTGRAVHKPDSDFNAEAQRRGERLAERGRSGKGWEMAARSCRTGSSFVFSAFFCGKSRGS